MSTPGSEPAVSPRAERSCSHEGCSCRVGPANGRRAEQYCSDGCASGAGCTHPDCNCAAYLTPMRGE